MANNAVIAPEDILTTSEVCSLLGVTRQTLYLWMQNGKISPWKKTGEGSTWLFLRKDAQRATGMRYKHGALGARPKMPAGT